MPSPPMVTMNNEITTRRSASPSRQPISSPSSIAPAITPITGTANVLMEATEDGSIPRMRNQVH